MNSDFNPSCARLSYREHNEVNFIMMKAYGMGDYLCEIDEAEISVTQRMEMLALVGLVSFRSYYSSGPPVKIR